MASINTDLEHLSIPKQKDNPNIKFSLVLMVEIGGNSFQALFDTGSTVSLIESSVVTGNIRRNDEITLRTAGSSHGLVSTFKVNQEFKINGTNFQYEFLVVETLNLPPISILLGFDLITKFKFEFKAKDQTEVFLDGRLVPSFQCPSLTVNAQVIKSAKEVSTFALVTEELNVPANCVLCIELKIVGRNLPENTQVLLLPHQGYSEILPHAMLTVVNNNNNVETYLYNLSNKPLHIYSHTSLALVEPVVPVPVIAVGAVINEQPQALAVQIAARTPPEFVDCMIEIGHQFSSLFVLADDEPTGYTDAMPFRIETGSAPPVKLRPYRIPLCHQAEVQDQLDRLEGEGIITLSHSPWSSPLVVVKKKNGSLRLCVDYRRLNALTLGDSFPLPSIEELLIKVSTSSYFTCLDLKSGYHQVCLDPETKQKTAFSVGDRLYEYNRLPFGLKNAPGHFSRLMTSVLANLINTSVLIYLDDLIILGDTPDQHVKNLVKVLDTLSKYNLKINLCKCAFFQQEVPFLGHIISKEGVRPVHDKVESIRNFPRPRTPKDVNSFLGLVGYYRKFIKDFAKISRPLDNLRKTDHFHWSPETEAAFQELKNKLTSNDLLAYPKFDRPFLVTCDASNTAIGGVVSQMDDEGKERPISFCSRALKGAEINYSALDREALAIKFTLERHRYFLLGFPIRILSDHQPLKYLFKSSDLNSRQSRWLENLLEFDIEEFEYIPGKANKVADALSRSVPVGEAAILPLTRARARELSQSRAKEISSSLPFEDNPSPPGGTPGEDLLSPDSNDVTESTSVCERSVTGPSVIEWDVAHLIDSQDRDPLWSKVKACIKDPSLPFPESLKLPRERFFIEGNVLYIRCKSSSEPKTVLTSEFVPLALKLVHDCPISGHMGVHRTLLRAEKNFYWINMRKDVRQYVKACHLCLCFKPHRHNHPKARKWPVTEAKFFRVHLDLVGPLPRSPCGRRYIAVISDNLTRYVFTHALSDKSAMSVAIALNQFITTFGCPREIVTDQGTEFINQTFQAISTYFRIKHVSVKAYRPSANGLVESKNRVLLNVLRIIVSENPNVWPDALPIATMALNSAFNVSVGDSPHFLVFLQDPRMPFEDFLDVHSKPIYDIQNYRDFLCSLNRTVYESVRTMLQKSTENHQKTYDIRFKTGESTIQVGDRVYCKRLQPKTSKMQSKYIGPFRVLEKSVDSFKLLNLFNDKISEVHASYVISPKVESIREPIFPHPQCYENE